MDLTYVRRQKGLTASPNGRAPSLSPEERSSGSGPEHVAAAPLTAEPLLQFDLGDWRRRVQVDPRLPSAADAPPAAYEGEILEESRLDRQDVIARHVSGAIDPVEHQNLEERRVVRFLGHRPELRRGKSLASNECSESILSIRFGIVIDADRNGVGIPVGVEIR